MTTYVELKRGDNDKSKKWGGKTLENPPKYLVKDLQEDLKSVGVFISTANGVFGPKTEKALKLFQWVCAKMTHCLKDKKHHSRVKTTKILIDGSLNLDTYNELTQWIKDKKEVTGDLIRISFSDLSNIEASPNFKKISSAKVFKTELVISKSAKKLISDINNKAKNQSVTIKVNQAFRENSVKLTGAVVTPAKKSQHLVGHAIDCNIVDGDNWNNSTSFKNKKETEGAKKLITALKKQDYRWGGDFTPIDSPHFDLKLDNTTFSYEAKFFLNQRMISLNHEIRKEKI